MMLKEKLSFREMLNNFDDQVTVRRLLEDHVPADVKICILDRYNAHVRRWNERLNERLQREQQKLGGGA